MWFVEIRSYSNATISRDRLLLRSYANRMMDIAAESQIRNWIDRADRVSVDEFEDGRFPEFNKAQLRSTSCVHLTETEYVENGPFSGQAANRLLSKWSLVRVQPRLPTDHIN
jgi:hypothetical protein